MSNEPEHAIYNLAIEAFGKMFDHEPEAVSPQGRLFKAISNAIADYEKVYWADPLNPPTPSSSSTSLS